MSTKAMTLRLSADKAAELEAIARVDDLPVSEEIRNAIDARIEERRRDKDFQARLREIVKQDQAILRRLAS
jgi:predicted transcriptional regulator